MTTVELHGVKLSVPDDHALPQIRKVLPDYAENIGRLAAAVELKYPGRGFVDVGANVGDTAAIVRAHSRLPILCIEGSCFYFDLLLRNVRAMADLEVECAMVDSAAGERHGRLQMERGTAAFRADARDGSLTHFDRLDDILARHPRFLSAKALKLDTDGMDGRIIVGALNWLAVARPVLFWEHDAGRDAVAGGPALRVFGELRAAGYRQALIFDNKGEYIQTVSLDSHQQLADLSDYLPGGENLLGYCDICAFHEEDSDLCAELRAKELENRRNRRLEDAGPLHQPLFQALVEAQFAVHRLEVTQAVHEAVGLALDRRGGREAELSAALAGRTAELQTLRAQAELDRYRLETRLKDQEKRFAVMDAEVHRVEVLLREVAGGRASMPCDEAELRKLRESGAKHQAEIGELQAQLERARSERDALRHDLESSLALRAARSLHWILGPLRRLIGPGGTSPGGQA